MINNSRVLKSIAAALAALLILLSPGVGCYSALAADFAAAPGAAGLPNGGLWAPRLQALIRPTSPFTGATLGGVSMSVLMRDLSAVDLRSAAGRVEAAPVLERLVKAQAAQAQPLSELQMAQAVAEAAAEQRAAALAVSKRIAEGAGADDAAAVSGALSSAVRHWALLGEDARRQVAAQSRVYAQRLETAKAARAADTVKATISSWVAKEPAGSALVRADFAARRAAPLARPTAAAARPGAKIIEQDFRRAAEIPLLSPRRPGAQGSSASKKSSILLIALPLAAAVAAAILVPALSPLLALTAGVVGSILLHETAHLYMLRRLGDGTAAAHGVTSLNPLKLVDPLGTVFLPIASALVSTALLGVPVLFGWAKPIPVDFNKLADPKRDSMKVALAGPAMNAALAVAALASLALLTPLHLIGAAAAGVLLTFAKVNGALAVFNMIPLPQLDGGKVLVGLLPQKLYQKWTANRRLPQEYQSTFTKLYEGPSTLLNYIGIDGQGKVNLVTRLITIGVFAGFAVAGWAWLGAPVLLLMLVCSYDYYCIREKIQNEEATRSLMDLLQRFSSALAAEAENDDSIQSVINTEEVEHILKNSLEDTIDKVVDTDGFDALTDAQKLERFQAAYMDAAVDALKKKGMSADDPETIRRVLTKLGLSALARGWIEKYDVWTKWHSPLRKKKKSLRDEVKQKGKTWGAGGTLPMIALGLLGGALALHGGLPFAAPFAAAGLSLMAGTLVDAPRKKQPSFFESMDDPNLKLTDKEKAFLLMMLSEMKVEQKAPVTGRIDELNQVVSAVTGPRGVVNSVVLIGKAGVGKTAIPEKLAQIMALSETQADGSTFRVTKMENRFLVKLDLAGLLTQDDPAAALKALISLLSRFNEESKKSGNKVVLFIDEVHDIFNNPKGPQMANMLKEPLRDGKLSVIAATTLKEYKTHMENDEAFRRRMVPIVVEESSVGETLRMMQGAQPYYEDLFGLKITPEALKAAAELSKFDQEVFLPGRAFKYLESAAKQADYDGQRDRAGMAINDKILELRHAMASLSEELAKKDLVTQSLKENEPTTIELYNVAVKLTQELVALYRKRDAIPTEGTPVLTDELVKEEIAKKTGVASGQLTLGQEPIEKYLEMEAIVGKRVIGQDEAIAAIAKSVRQNKAGLSDPKRPMGVFYLTGPTGSGKTHLAKELARFLFNDPEAVIRVDMTEYQESHAKSRMIGSPPGYVGFEAGGQLTEAVRKKPYSVILLDEIEKAHPDVFLLLLQIMGEGRLTDGQGRLVDFKNTMILMTSNLGMFAVDVEKYAKAFKTLQEQKRDAEIAGDAETIGMLDAQMRVLATQLSEETKRRSQEITEQAFKETYPPEFQGRLHAPPIVFNRITPESALKIAELNLRELRDVLAYAGHEIEWTPAVTAHVVNEGFSVALGARPLQNAIDRLITQPIATEILKSAMANGQKVAPSKLVVSMEQGVLKIQVLPLPPKQVSRRQPGDAAIQEVFTEVLQQTLAGAAGTASPIPSLETVDSWVRRALAAHGTQEDGATAEKPETESSRSQAPESRSPETVVPAPQPAQASSLARPATPLVLTSAQSFQASHFEHERKDPSVKAGAAAIQAALEAQGYPEETRQAVLRTVEYPAEPYMGFLKLFVEQAKKMTPADARTAPVRVSYETGDALRVVVTRPGTLGDKEQTVLRAHFTGPVPATAAAARDKAEALNVMGQDGRRLMFDLYRKLSAIPGAKIGWAQTEEGTQYWIELPKPQAPEALPPTPDTERHVPEDPALTRVDLDAGKAAFADAGLVQGNSAINRAMQDAEFPRETRGLAAGFLRAMAEQLKGFSDTRGLKLEYAVSGDKAKIVLSRDADFTQDETDRIRGYFGQNLEMAHAIADTWSQMDIRGGAVSLELPNTTAISQGDGFAGSSGAAATPAVSEEAAARLAKIATANAGGAPHTVWITFQGARFETQIKPLLAALGVTYKERQESGDRARVKIWLPNLATANTALLALLDESSVASITVDPELVASLRAAAGRVEAPAAGLAKLQTGPQGALDDRSLWVSFEAANASEVDAVIGRAGGAVRERQVNGRFARLRVAYATPAKAAAAALVFAGADLVRTITAHDDLLARARALDKVRQHATLDVQSAPLTAYVSLMLGAPSAELETLLGAAVKVVESPHSGHPSIRLRVAFASPGDAERFTLALGARADVEKIVVGSDLYRILTEGTVTASARDSDGLKGLAREFALRVLEQGDQRSTSVRVAAADLLGAASTPADLAQAREWVALDGAISSRWPEIAAGALVIARQGSRADDEARLITALGYMSFGSYGSDLYKPAKRRLVESLAKLLATDNPAKIRELVERYGEEKEKNAYSRYSGGYGSSNSELHESQFHRYKNDLLLEALFLAMTKYAGPEARALVLAGWDQKRSPQVFEYMKRVDPAFLQALATRWREGSGAPDGVNRMLMLYAAAEYGTRADARKLFADASSGWGGVLDNQTTPIAADAAAKLVARTGAWDLVEADARRALRERMSDSGNFARMITAVMTAGAAGDESDLTRLEELLRSDPSVVNYVHEMSQHESASAWARLVHDLGLTERYLTLARPAPVGQPALPILQAMLVDTNPIVNEAAMEVLRLRFTERAARRQAAPAVGGPAPASGPEAGPAPSNVVRLQGFFREAALDFPANLGWSTYYSPEDPALAASRPQLARLTAEQRSRAADWTARFGRILEGLLGVPFTPEVRYVESGDGRLWLAWVLKQSVTQTISAAKIQQVGELVNLLLYIRGQGEESRIVQLRRLEQLGYQDPAGLYELLQRLQADTQVKMGLNHEPALSHTPGRAETEVWLKFDVPAPPPPSRPRPYRGRHLEDNDFPDGFL